MTEDEFAFYEALRENESAVRDMGDPVLKALAHELTVVTRNLREFERVPSLRVENWIDG